MRRLGSILAMVSDRDGRPEVWLSPLERPGEPVRLDTGDDYVRAITWSPDGEWLCVLTAPGGGERTRVSALRPDGTEARVIAGTPTGMAWIGRWQPGGHVVGLSESSATAPGSLDAYAVDVCSGHRHKFGERSGGGLRFQPQRALRHRACRLPWRPPLVVRRHPDRSRW